MFVYKVIWSIHSLIFFFNLQEKKKKKIPFI